MCLLRSLVFKHFLQYFSYVFLIYTSVFSYLYICITYLHFIYICTVDFYSFHLCCTAIARPLASLHTCIEAAAVPGPAAVEALFQHELGPAVCWRVVVWLWCGCWLLNLLLTRTLTPALNLLVKLRNAWPHEISETVRNFQIEGVITGVGDDGFHSVSPRWLNWSCKLLKSHCDFIGCCRCLNTSAQYPITVIAVSPAPFLSSHVHLVAMLLLSLPLSLEGSKG